MFISFLDNTVYQCSLPLVYWSSDSKKSSCNAGDLGSNPGSDPWVRKIPWRREWHPTPVFLTGELHGQRSLVGYSPRGSQRVGHNWVTNTFTFSKEDQRGAITSETFPFPVYHNFQHSGWIIEGSNIKKERIWQGFGYSLFLECHCLLLARVEIESMVS